MLNLNLPTRYMGVLLFPAGAAVLGLLPVFLYIDPNAVNADSLRESARLACISLYKESPLSKANERKSLILRQEINNELWYPPFVRSLRRRLGMTKFKSEEDMRQKYKDSLIVQIPHCR